MRSQWKEFSIDGSDSLTITWTAINLQIVTTFSSVVTPRPTLASPLTRLILCTFCHWFYGTFCLNIQLMDKNDRKLLIKHRFKWKVELIVLRSECLTTEQEVNRFEVCLRTGRLKGWSTRFKEFQVFHSRLGQIKWSIKFRFE